MAFDTADGRMIWKAERPPGLEIQSPHVLSDSIVTVTRTSAPTTTSPADEPKPDPRFVHSIRRYRLSDGREIPPGKQGPIAMDDIRSFGGLFVRDRCLVILDGARLIGYVGKGP